MLTILSPAMNMNRRAAEITTYDLEVTRPIFHKDAKKLADTLQTYGPLELSTLLSTNPKIALDAYENYCGFGDGDGSAALLSFQGLAYKNIRPEEFTSQELAYSHDHLRILSALYGILRPLDGIFPYRLDFMCRFAKGKEWGENLYAFWGDRVHKQLFKTGELVVNLCSAEYTKLIEPHLKREDEFVTCRFLESTQGGLVCRATASKMARGQMARFIIENRIEDPEEVKDFDWNGYRFSPNQSHSKLLTFIS